MAGQRKSAYILDVLRGVQQIISVMDDLSNLENEYFDNGYDGAGADPIADSHLAIHDITAAQFSNVITFMQQLEKFRTNQLVTQADYAATLNAVRRAPV